MTLSSLVKLNEWTALFKTRLPMPWRYQQSNQRNYGFSFYQMQLISWILFQNIILIGIHPTTSSSKQLTTLPPLPFNLLLGTRDMAHIAAINQTKLSDNPAVHYYVGPAPYHILFYNLKTNQTIVSHNFKQLDDIPTQLTLQLLLDDFISYSNTIGLAGVIQNSPDQPSSQDFNDCAIGMSHWYLQFQWWRLLLQPSFPFVRFETNFPSIIFSFCYVFTCHKRSYYT